nr:unnamed protein product [Callosobruchus chinensis]
MMQQSSNRYRPFMQKNQVGNFPQSLSGSETDVSTSNENLSNEEKYVIRHTPRQEPQGQENLTDSKRSSLRDSLPSNRSSLDVSSSSYNTLIIHSAGDEPWTGRNSGPRDSTNISPPSYLSHQSSNFYTDPKLSPIQKRSSASPSPSITSTGVQEITEIPDDYLSQSSVLKHLAKEVKGPTSGNALKDDNVEGGLLSKFEPSNYENRLPPPPDYPGKWADRSPLQQEVNAKNKGGVSVEKTSLSKSQPDLSTAGNTKPDLTGFRRGVSAPRPPTKGREENDSKVSEVWPSAEMVEILIRENSALKQELENCYQRVERTQRVSGIRSLEQEILKVHKSHEELVASCDRRERLERAARARLQADVRRHQELCRALREQLDLVSAQQAVGRSPGSSQDQDALIRELAKREAIIKQLITQNKELSAAKERQEIELAAQRATLQEQRTHIDILDTALINAQGNVVRLEEECRKKQVYMERVAQLQRALSSLQLASDRREQTERKLRAQLERELQRAKAQQGNQGAQGGDGEQGGGGGGGNAGWESPDGAGGHDTGELKRKLREKEERIMALEGECAKWEQRFLEESTLRQAAIDAASIPKDAKIAALEKTSQETEKIIAEARNEKIRHMDEVHAAQKRVADLESRLKDLESKLAEKDAMIRVLQKHTYDKDVSSMLGRSPHHTPHGSLGGTDIDHVLGTTVSREELVNSVLNNSSAYGSASSYSGAGGSSSSASESAYHHRHAVSQQGALEARRLQDIDTQLDSQLLSKRALCCFPGFTNPVAAQRKGKLPKPLLAGVARGSVAVGVAGAQNSPAPVAEMLLLEKQGRTSQQQRGPIGGGKVGVPSSLPRPPREGRGSGGSSSAHRSGLPRYNRLETPPPSERKKSQDGGSGGGSSRASPARSSLIPSPRKLGEYGRLSESGGSSASLRKPPSSGARARSGSAGERDSASTLSGDSASSLPPPSRLRLYGSLRRGGSLGREDGNGKDTGKYRIQF